MRIADSWRRAGLVALALLVGGGCGGDGPTAGDGGRVIQVEVVDFSFRPDTVDARVGDIIRWIQRDATPHTVTSSDPPPGVPDGFDQPVDAPGDVVEVVLTRPDTIAYFCRPHPFMQGTIFVRP